uniref:F-box domain-containing protein n=1 Tax=Meloidogyne enterolobii TaxID=390850 RepID=A0A6V7YD50_MELEN|nr:unnamed protein product [Meloidogyne enterolobii]
MYFLPPEVQLDIFKYLDFNQLISIQQANGYYKNFIYEFENQLARKEFDVIRLLYDNKDHYTFKLEPKFYEFQLSEQLEKSGKLV